MRQHREFFALIPWYLNGTVDERQRKHLEAHLADCSACRAELQLERRVHEGMTADPGVEYMPAPSLKRLQARLDALDALDVTRLDESGGAAAVGAAGEERPPIARSMRREMPWQSMMAAAVIVAVAALSLLLVDRRLQGPGAPGTYHTVTSPLPRAPEEVIRAVFAPTITLVELQAILDESQLRIVAGPTEAGVYSLAANSDRSATASLDMLRRHAAVRFAESTQPAAPDDSR